MNVLKPNKKAAIITLLTNGVSRHEISRKAGIDRKTVRKYARLYLGAAVAGQEESKSPTSQQVATGEEATVSQNPPPRPPAHARSACQENGPWIESQVQLGRNAMAIYQDLVEQFGFSHRYNSVKRFVRAMRKKQPQQFDRLEFLPGEEAQVDYGEGALTLHPGTGKYRRPRLFVMTLRYSRRSFRKVVWQSSQEVWAKLHEEAFRYFGGCPEYVVLDNLKEGVIRKGLRVTSSYVRFDGQPIARPDDKAFLPHTDALNQRGAGTRPSGYSHNLGKGAEGNIFICQI